jgi:hypothetical protein
MSDQDLILERLARIEEKLDRVAAVEKRLDDFARPWDSLADLGRDLSLLTGPSVRLLTEELAEVETGFQMEDILAMIKRLMLSFRHLAWALAVGESHRLVARYGARIEGSRAPSHR